MVSDVGFIQSFSKHEFTHSSGSIHHQHAIVILELFLRDSTNDRFHHNYIQVIILKGTNFLDEESYKLNG